jgi:hypothetical protein
MIGCIGVQRLILVTDPSSLISQFTITSPVPVSLRSTSGGPRGLRLQVTSSFAVLQDRSNRRRVVERMYAYRLLDHQHTELLVYHWQPGPDFRGPDQPHLHVSAALSAKTDAVARENIGLDRRHIATGRVSPADIIRMLITEFDVAPQRHNWQSVLDNSEQDWQSALGVSADPAERQV